MKLVEIARRYIEINDFALIPIKLKMKYPAIDGWQNKWSKDLMKIEEWFGEGKSNIGIVTGKPSNIWVLDIDGEVGKASMLKILQEHNKKMPETAQVYTGGGGLHYFWKYDDRIPANRAKVYDGIDIRSTGGQVVAPPSIHPNGQKYRWHIPENRKSEILKAPEWLINALIQKQTVIVNNKGSFMQGARNDTLYRRACKYVNDGLSKSTYHDLIHKINLNQCNPPLPTQEVDRIILSAEKHLEKPEEHIDVIQMDANTKMRVTEAFRKSWNRTERIIGYKLGDNFRELETVMEGIQKGFYLLGAIPNVGKTSFLLNLCYNLIYSNDDLHVLFFSLDDDFNAIYYRLLALISQQKINYCANIGGTMNQSQMEQMSDSAKEVDEFMTKFHLLDDVDGNTFDFIETVSKSFSEKYDNLVIIVDNFHKIRTKNTFQTKKENVANLSSNLKTMKNKLDVVLICTVELRKLNHSGAPNPDDMKDAVELHYDAQVVWMLHSDSERNQTSEQIYHSATDTYPIIELNVNKNKLSSFKKKIEYVFQPSLVNFWELK